MPTVINPNLIKRILVVRTDRLGDVVLTTPAIKALRQAFPQAHIALLVSPATVPILEHNPYVNQILVDDRRGTHRSWLMGFLRLARLIRQQSFDIAIIYHTKRRYNLACFLAGVPIRLGYKDKNAGFLLTHPLKDTRHLGQKHETQYCLEVLKSLNIHDADHPWPGVVVDASSLTWAQQWIKEHIPQGYGLVLVHPGASDLTRRWSKENFIACMDQISQTYLVKVALIGTTDISHLADEINHRLKIKAIDLTGKTDIAQLMGLMVNAKMVISNDSGPAHVAAALGVPVISIFLRSQPGLNPERWSVKGPYAMTITPSNQQGIILNKNLEVIKGDPTAISVEDLMQAVHTLWRRYEQNQFDWYTI